MAHLAPTYDSYRTFLQGADEFFAADLTALNNSGVTGTALFSIREDDDGSTYVNVSVNATGLTPGVAHPQHVHGLFDADGMPINSMPPSLADDADADGFIEVLEGVPSYGDVLLSLNDLSEEDETDTTGTTPVATSAGELSYIEAFDAAEDAFFVSPVTTTQYSFEDITPLSLREYVIHGLELPQPYGEGTEGEVNGTEGYVQILPVAASEIFRVTQDEALARLDAQELASAQVYTLTGGDDLLGAGGGADTVIAGAGNDTIVAGAGDDDVAGFAGDDVLYGGMGMDRLNGGSGNDTIVAGEDDDQVLGGRDDDVIAGGAGDDTIVGGAGDDSIAGGTGDDQIAGSGGNDTVRGNDGDDNLFGVGGDDLVEGGRGDDLVGGGAGNDTLMGGEGRDFMNGGAGDDLVVGGAGLDVMFGGAGADIMGGGGGDDRLTGGAGADEFHFDAGTGADIIRDFTQGEDVISFLDGGAVEFANSTENDTRGDSDLSADDFDTVAMVSELEAANDQQVVYSTGTNEDAMTMNGAAVEAYLAVSDGTDTYLYYDADWSGLEGRELIATLDGFGAAMTVSDFDVY